MRYIGAAVIALVGVAVVALTGRWWFAERIKADYTYRERLDAVRLAGIGLLLVAVAARVAF